MLAGLHPLLSRVIVDAPEATAEALVDRFANELAQTKLFSLAFASEDGASSILNDDDPKFVDGMRFALSRTLLHSNRRVQVSPKPFFWCCALPLNPRRSPLSLPHPPRLFIFEGTDGLIESFRFV